VTREQKDSSFGDFVKPITPSKASDVFDQASHDYEALKDYRYYSGLMSPEEEQRETWHREAHEAARQGRACILYDEWPNAPGMAAQGEGPDVIRGHGAAQSVSDGPSSV
jgi:hypothetical protein